MAGCLLATDGSSLLLEGVRFRDCVAAGAAPENPLWSVGAGFGGAAAVVGENCLDDDSWMDSEGRNCLFYNSLTAGGQPTLIMPGRGMDHTGEWKGAKLDAIARCERAADYSSGGVDASAACCACKWHLQGRVLGLLAGQLLAQDGGECANTECRNPNPSGGNQVRLHDFSSSP